MKNTIVNLIVVATLASSGAALAAGETENKAQPAATQPPATQPVAAASAVPQTTTAKPAPAAPAKEPQPAVKRSASSKSAEAKPPRSKNLDLRHCLELENNAAIAKCAGE